MKKKIQTTESKPMQNLRFIIKEKTKIILELEEQLEQCKEDRLRIYKMYKSMETINKVLLEKEK